MKKIYFLLFSLFFLQSAFAYTVKEKQAYDIRLKNGLYMNVAVCTDGIFRVRITPKKALEESLMERYGIIKTDWKNVNVKHNLLNISLC